MEFGYKELVEEVQAVIETSNNTEMLKDDVSSRIVDNLLLSNTRSGVSKKNYTDEMYKADCETIKHMLDENWGKDKKEMPDWVEQFIRMSPPVNGLVQDTLNVIAAEYKLLFQDGFGLKPYVAILTFQNGYEGMTVNENMHEGVVVGSSALFRKLSKTIKEHYKVISSTKRQFDVDAILDSELPVYFPYKMLEYAMGRKLTKHTNRYVYEPLQGITSWDIYWEKFAKGQITEVLYAVMFRAFKDIAGDKDLNNVSKEEASNLRLLFDDLLYDGIKERYLLKVQASLCTCLIVRTYNTVGGVPNAICLRGVDTVSGLDFGLTPKLFSWITTKGGAVDYNDGYYVGEGLTYPIVEYNHDFNEELSSAEPLFGYKAVQLYKKRGIAISWDKILLGEDYKGTPIFSSADSTITIQNRLIHNVFAGTRAGKGVMTMNLISCAMAAGKPVFYIDRKPDMAIMFHQLSGGNMFLVNGGQQNLDDDVDGLFQDGGVAIKGWEEAYERMPAFLKENIFTAKTYGGVFGDMVYFRAVMFVLGILYARALASGASYIGNLGGSNGILVIIDEFSNWQNVFEAANLVPGSGIFSHQISASDEKAYDDLKIKIMQEELKLNNAKPEQVPVIEARLAGYKQRLANTISPMKVYCTELMQKLHKGFAAWNSASTAGFKDKESLKSDVFVIGQNIDRNSGYNDGGESTLFKEISGKFSESGDAKSVSIIRRHLGTMENDWFIGKQAEKPEYWGQSEDGSKTKRWLHDKCYWGYTTDYNTQAGIESLRKNVPSNLRIFKPYLVLNNNIEDDPVARKQLEDADKGISEGQPKTPKPREYYTSTYVAQCRNRVNKADPSGKLWEKVRLSNLNMPEGANPEDYSAIGNLHEGIGFEGLTSMVKETNGLGEFNPAVDLQASKTIADYVAGCMGYSSYWDLLLDFSPLGIFGVEDVLKALENPNAYRDLTVRLPIHTKYNMFNSSEGDGSVDYSNSTLEDDYYNNMQENLTEPVSTSTPEPVGAEDYTDGAYYEPSGSGMSDSDAVDLRSKAEQAWASLGAVKQPTVEEQDDGLTDDEISAVCQSAIIAEGFNWDEEQTSTFINGIIEKWHILNGRK